MRSYAEDYEANWHSYAERHPNDSYVKTGNPDSDKCRGCGGPKTPHKGMYAVAGPVFWCARCDEPDTKP